jgi:TetR/AcrR family transcriptional repressor of nem operon
VSLSEKNRPSRVRETILDAAIRLFQQHGFGGLGMRQIADRLQIKAPSLYHHFASKEDLAREALRQYREEQAARLLAISESGDLTEKLQAYAELFAEVLHGDTRPCLYLAMVREPSVQIESCTAELRLFAKQNVDWLEGILRNEDGLRLLEAMSAREIAELIFGSFEGIMAISLAERKPAAVFRKRASNFLKMVTNT